MGREEMRQTKTSRNIRDENKCVDNPVDKWVENGVNYREG
jgi:hypothetical protein